MGPIKSPAASEPETQFSPATLYQKFALLAPKEIDDLRRRAQEQLHERQEELQRINVIEDKDKRREAIRDFVLSVKYVDAAGLCVRFLVQEYMKKFFPEGEVSVEEISSRAMRPVLGNGWNFVTYGEKMNFSAMGKADFRTEEEEGGKKRQDEQIAALHKLMRAHWRSQKDMETYIATSCPDVAPLRILNEQLPAEVLAQIKGKDMYGLESASWFYPSPKANTGGLVIREIGKGKERRFWIEYLSHNDVEKLTMEFAARQETKGFIARLFGRK